MIPIIGLEDDVSSGAGSGTSPVTLTKIKTFKTIATLLL